MDYEGEILSSSEIKDVENYLWLFTKDYPLIYEVWDKKDNSSLCIVGETEIYEKIKTLYRINLTNSKEAAKFYKLIKALFILQTELPHYYKFETNIDEEAMLNFYLDNVKIEYETLPEFIMEQYLKSVTLKNKADNDLEELHLKLESLNKESQDLENEYIAKEKQITTYLECKKTFFGKVKYFFTSGKKVKKVEKTKKEEDSKKTTKTKKEKFKLEERNYTLYELEQSFKELAIKEEENKKLIMDINALKLKNKNLKKKIENATGYIEEINKHKKSIFEFWKYSNKDAVASLDEGEEEGFNNVKLEKIFNFENDFEYFGIDIDKLQRNKLTDDEMDSVFIASTNLLNLINRIDLKLAENKEISEALKKMKAEKEKGQESDEDEDEIFNIFGRMKQTASRERTIGNKVHREEPRDKYEILEIKKGSKGVELKRKLEKVIKNIKTAINKNSLKEDMYVYKVMSEEKELDGIEAFSLDSEKELKEFLIKNKICNKIYLYKIRLTKDTNYAAFTNIIFFDNKNMTLPVGMDLSSKILVDLSKLNLSKKQEKELNKLEFEDEEDDFSKIIVKTIEVKEME